MTEKQIQERLELEGNSVFQSLRLQCDTLKAQNAALLEALEQAENDLTVSGPCPAGCGGSNEGGHEDGCALLEIRAAIAAAKEGR